MMATTHVLAGMLVGIALAPLVPGETTPLVVAGAAGGLAPDFDAVGAHRKDLHFPVYGSVLALGALGIALGTGAHPAFVATAFLAAAALHAVSDAFGGGRSLRPWAESVDRAVYCHAQGRWWRPRRWISYDGSPTDLAVALGLGVAVLVLVDVTAVRVGVVGLVCVSTAYVLVRKRVPGFVEALGRRVEDRVGAARTGRSS